MTARRAGSTGPIRNPLAPLALSVAGGGATAGFAAFYLRPALDDVAHCRSSTGGTGCASHPFWGFSPELYLAACAIGVAAGLLMAIVGVLTFRGWLDARRGGYGLVALSAAGVIAYGGLGAGVAAGVAAGALLVSAASAPAPAPPEWTGSLPAGTPPAPRNAKRVLTARPPVTEWEGVFAAAPAGPPGGGRGRVVLPQADRLAAALQRSGAAPGPGTSGPTPVVVLPPPPLGLRGISRPAAPTPRIAEPERPAPEPTSSRGPAAGSWRPEPSEMAPWAGGVHPALTPAAPAEPSAPAAPPAPRPDRAPAARPPPPAPSAGGARAAAGLAPRPLAESQRETRPSAAAREPRSASRPGLPSERFASTRPRGLHRTQGPLTAPSPTRAPASGPVPRAEPRAEAAPLADRAPPPAPQVAPQVVSPPAPRPDSPPPAPDTARPPAPTVPLAKGRTRAWKCPACGLINAPWSPRCTKCQTVAVDVG